MPSKQPMPEIVIPPAPPMKMGPKVWSLQEGFEGSWLPAGWDTTHLLGTSATVFITRVTAGTSPTCSPHAGTYMVKYNCYSISTARMRLATPPVLVNGTTDSLSFWMTHDPGYAAYNDRIVVEIMSNSGGGWGPWTAVDSFSRYQASFAWLYHALSLAAYNGDSVRISLTGHSAYGNNIYLDDVAIGCAYTPVAGDLALQSIDVPAAAFMEPNVPFTPTVTIRNPGTTPVSDYQVIYQIDDGAKALVYSDTVFVNTPDTLISGADTVIAFDDFTPLDVTNYTITAYVAIAGDPFAANDTLYGYFRTFDDLLGMVTDDNNGGAPLAGVAINATGPATYNTTTDGSGNYSFFDMAAGTYTVTATLAGYVTEAMPGVTITDNMQTVQDISMGYPVLAYGPMDSMYVSLGWGLADSTTWDLTLSNTGTRDLHYSVSWPETTLVKGGSKDPVSLVVDDGTAENGIGIGGASQFIWVNRFTPAPAEFPFMLQQVQLWFQTSGAVLVGDSIQIVVYENTTGSTDPAPGSNLLYQYSTTVQGLDAWNVYDLPEPVLLNGPGDVVIGVIGLEVPGTSYWPASLDQTVTQQRSWAGWWATPVHPEPPTLPPDTWTLIDAYFPGNWMVRGYGETGGGNVAWLTIDQPAGTISAGNTNNLNVAFSTAGCDSFTDWAATVRINSDGAIAKAKYSVPTYMHVLGYLGVAGNPVEPVKPALFALKANYPNPARGRTTFSFSLPKAGEYRLTVYNITGQQVHSVSGAGRAGANNVAWDTRKMGGGVYFYTLSAGDQHATGKLVVVR